MSPKCLAPALVIAFTSVLSASCLREEPEADATGSPTASVERVNEPSGPEPIGEAPQPMGHIGRVYGSKDFPFVAWIKDDGKGKAGGSQRSITRLGFVVEHGIKVVYEWECPVAIDVPIRTEILGTSRGSYSPGGSSPSK